VQRRICGAAGEAIGVTEMAGKVGREVTQRTFRDAHMKGSGSVSVIRYE
jgi:hypothetical protein